jgi:hypothetical protein
MLDRFLRPLKNKKATAYLKDCHRAGLLFYTLFMVLVTGTSTKALEIVRLSVNKKLLDKLRRENAVFIKEYLKKENMENNNNGIIKQEGNTI